jgi:tetratricopeptide (TPR) repeat protein
MRALELDPSRIGSRSGLAWITWAWRQDYAEAGRLFRQGLDVAPESTGLLNGYAYLLWQCSRDDEAEELFERAIAIRPQAVVPRSNLVMLLLRANRLAEAAEQLDEIKVINPASEWIHRHSGNLALQRGNAGLAIQNFLNYRGPTRNWELSEAYLSLGRTDEALAALGRHIEQAQVAVPVIRAAYHAIAQDRDEAFDLLDIAFRDRDPAIRALPDILAFDVLHDDKRWSDLLERWKLNEQTIHKACSQIPVTES